MERSVQLPAVWLGLCALLALAACDSEASLQPLPSGPTTGEEVAPPSIVGLSARARPGASAQEPGSTGHGPPYPIVLVHGFSGFNRLGPLEYFFRVIDKLHEDGEDEVYAPALPPYNSVEARAPYLADFIDQVLEQTGARKVHVIAHSQGGLDARRVIAGLGYADQVATLTTVATPHHGTPVGEHILALPPDAMDPIARLLAWLIGAVDSPDNEPPADEGWRSDMEACASSLTPQALAAFNAAHPDPPGVDIFSVAGVSNFQRADGLCALSQWGRLQRVDATDPLLYPTAALLSGHDLFHPIANDGMLPSDSMVWGTFLGCIPADHFDEIGQIADLAPNLVSRFDHIEFYRRLVSHLRSWELEHADGQ